MELNDAKTRLHGFLGDRELTFSIRKYPDGEWVAECNEIPAIMTGGKADDITNIDTMIRDAILTAAGVDPKYANEILKFVGYRQANRIGNLFRTERTEAEYVLS
jgi:hypothetical protein